MSRTKFGGLEPGESLSSYGKRWAADKAERRGRLMTLWDQSGVAAIRGFGGNDKPIMAIRTGEMDQTSGKRQRVTFFGEDGPLGHVSENWDEEIAEAAIDWVYPPFQTMTAAEVNDWMSTQVFLEGSQRVAFVQAINSLSWFASKAGRSDWAQIQMGRANDLFAAGHRDRALDGLYAALRELPEQNPPPRMGFVSNPPWVTQALARSYETLESKVPPRWLPQLQKVRKTKGNQITARLIEFGCGMYGCVLPTLDPTIVLKVTTDTSEAEFAAHTAGELVADVCVHYTLVMRLAQKHEKRDIHLLWRESAEHVGQVDEVLGLEAGSLVDAQHAAAQAAYHALQTGEDQADITDKIREWLDACEMIARRAPKELRHLGRGLVEIYETQRILFGDIHAGNLGIVTRDGEKLWVITDPGHVANLSGVT